MYQPYMAIITDKMAFISDRRLEKIKRHYRLEMGNEALRTAIVSMAQRSTPKQQKQIIRFIDHIR